MIGRNVSALSFLDVLFGSESPLLPAETFYQRALEGRSIALSKSALLHIGQHSRADYYDHVALPALVLAQQDRGGEEPELVDPIVEQFQHLVDALQPAALGGDEPWQREGAVLSIPARGDFDELAATMLAQTLQDAGFGAVVTPDRALDHLPASGVPPLLCCISVIEEGAVLATIRLFILKVRHNMPDTPIVIALWGAKPDSVLLSALREETMPLHITRSLGELLAYVRAISIQAETV